MFLLLLLKGREGVLVRDALDRSSGDPSKFSERKIIEKFIEKIRQISGKKYDFFVK
jgi:hypothetical protein